MARKKLMSFGIFCNRIVGERVKAVDFDDLLENRLSKRLKTFWSEIKFQDQDGNTICINREFLEDQGMSFDEVVADWKDNASPEELEEVIHAI